jgi:hypothetical protein
MAFSSVIATRFMTALAGAPGRTVGSGQATGENPHGAAEGVFPWPDDSGFWFLLYC